MAKYKFTITDTKSTMLAMQTIEKRWIDDMVYLFLQLNPTSRNKDQIHDFFTWLKFHNIVFNMNESQELWEDYQGSIKNKKWPLTPKQYERRWVKNHRTESKYQVNIMFI